MSKVKVDDVKLLEKLLNGETLKWSEWEAHYKGAILKLDEKLKEVERMIGLYGYDLRKAEEIIAKERQGYKDRIKKIHKAMHQQTNLKSKKQR